MEALVLSDTHGRRYAIEAVLRQVNFRPEAILFLGDGLRDLSVLSAREEWQMLSVYAVAGNCDSLFLFPADAPEERMVQLGDTRILLMHGHTYGVRRGLGAAICHAAEWSADVLLYGHTHIPYETVLHKGTVLSDGTILEKPLLVANPGSLGEPRDGFCAGFGVLTVRPNGVLFSHGTLKN